MDYARSSLSVHHQKPVRVSAKTAQNGGGTTYHAVTLGGWQDEAPEVTLFLADGDPLWDVLNAYAEGKKIG